MHGRKLFELSSGILIAISATASQEIMQWSILEIHLIAQDEHGWHEFPVQATFTHAASGTEITVDGFWDGEKNWRVRFTPTLAGEWQWSTSSSDPGLNGRSGCLTATAPTEQQIGQNPNYRGHIGISPNGRYFQYADGAPFFLLADTLWAGNTARCGLGSNEDGPFYRYLATRKSMGYTTVLMQYMRGFGDTNTEPAGQRNEGGHPFVDGDVSQMNSSFFQALDVRMDALWRNGLVAATPVTWFGKVGNCFFSLEWAKRISAYLMVRYGAYNLLWSLAGEYQYAFKDCGWSTEDISELGNTVQERNSYHHPVSIHPSGRIDWEDLHGVQSSKVYHNSGWLDHNWLQTGQSIDRMCYIAIRCIENRELEPVRPVFCSEAYYERPLTVDAEGAYHSRWQAWCAFLNGAAGYGYGAFGLWQFYDPDDPEGETGKKVKGVVPWQEALAFDGSAKLQHLAALLTAYEWWKLEPGREWLTVNGSSNPLPTDSDLTPPHCAAIRGKLYIVYIPRGNSDNTMVITNLDSMDYSARWVDPRNGNEISITNAPRGIGKWTIPDLPQSSVEDWVLVLDAKS